MTYNVFGGTLSFTQLQLPLLPPYNYHSYVVYWRSRGLVTALQ